MLDFGGQRDLPTVLLIDDDPISREVAATVLTMSGYTVHTADSGAASLESLAAGTCVPGVILMDAQMPGLGRGQGHLQARQGRAGVGYEEAGEAHGGLPGTAAGTVHHTADVVSRLRRDTTWGPEKRPGVDRPVLADLKRGLG